VQAAATAALAEDAHVDEQRGRYARRRKQAQDALGEWGLVHDGGPSTFYLWLRAPEGREEGWAITRRLAEQGLLVAPGDLYGPDGSAHVRLSLRPTTASRWRSNVWPRRSGCERPRRADPRLWDGRDDLAAVMSPSEARAVVHEAIELLDRGEARVAEVVDGEVVVHEWLKQAILLLFRLEGLSVVEAGPFEYHDKLPLKHDYASARVRVVPGGSARWGSYLGPGVILMPSYVNIGARVGADTMVDTWATVGSCGQIGERVHLSGGVGIGGVLRAAPGGARHHRGRHDDRQPLHDHAGRPCRPGQRVLGEGVILNPAIPVIGTQTGEEVRVASSRRGASSCRRPASASSRRRVRTSVRLDHAPPRTGGARQGEAQRDPA
jgi:2,3,4,5-tetrahydropyridine-2-carboxylate N-succinyltransferase